MARIALDPPRTLLFRCCAWFSKRRFGAVLDPLKVAGHHPGVLRSYAIFEMGAERWRKLDRGLKELAVLAAAARVGCRWCLDFGYWKLRVGGMPVEKLEAIANWRDSDAYTDQERLVIEYAEAMSDTPPRVDDELVGRLRATLSEAQLVELTAIVAVENLRSRINAAAGLTGQGFKDRCAPPARTGLR